MDQGGSGEFSVCFEMNFKGLGGVRVLGGLFRKGGTTFLILLF